MLQCVGSCCKDHVTKAGKGGLFCQHLVTWENCKLSVADQAWLRSLRLFILQSMKSMLRMYSSSSFFPSFFLQFHNTRGPPILSGQLRLFLHYPVHCQAFRALAIRKNGSMTCSLCMLGGIACSWCMLSGMTCS